MIEPDDTPGIPEPIRRRIVDTLAAGGTLTSIPYVKSVPLRYGQVDFGRLAEFLGLLDGSDAARVLAMYENELTDDELLRLLPSTFLAADSPPLWVSDDRWVEMWNRVGFTIDGTPAQRPDGEIVLFRTINVWLAVFGMSWRGDASTSVRHLIQQPGRPLMETTTCSAAFPWSRVLAVIDSQHEAVYVVNTRDGAPFRWIEKPVNDP